jgi:hypothetical protein
VVLISLLITFTIAYQVNVRKEKYTAWIRLFLLKRAILCLHPIPVFNWGGTSDQVQTITTTLQSRSHNELVVDKLQFYINYLVQGEYNLIDGYGSVLSCNHR